MKKRLLLFAGLLIGLTTASATELNTNNPDTHFDINKRNRYAQPIMFVERGVEFLIFPDGSFDFNTNTRNGYNYYKPNSRRRNNVNVGYRGPNARIQFSTYNSNRGVSISRYRNGNIKRIGNVYLNYDRFGNITRAGSVFIDYNRGNGLVRQVGGLKVKYNRWGEIVNLRGQVNHFNNNCNVCGDFLCDVNHNHGKNRNRNKDWNNRYNDDVYNNDDNYYYYKQNGKVKKQKKNKR